MRSGLLDRWSADRRSRFQSPPSARHCSSASSATSRFNAADSEPSTPSQRQVGTAAVEIIIMIMIIIQDRILSRVISVNDDMFDKCLSTRISNGIQPPVDSDMHKQRKWDKSVIDAEFNHLLSHYSEPYHKARLLAAAAPHSGDWLHALPISACGLHLEDNVIRVPYGRNFRGAGPGSVLVIGRSMRESMREEVSL